MNSFPFIVVVCVHASFVLVIYFHAWYLLTLNLTCNFQNMEKDFKFCTMKLGRNMMHILITSLMSSTPRMEANELPLFWCICKMVFPFHKSSVYCLLFFFSFLSFFPISQIFAINSGQMLKKVVRQCFLLPKGMSALCGGGMNYLNVVNRDLLWNLKWGMHYYFGAWDLMLV